MKTQLRSEQDVQIDSFRQELYRVKFETVEKPKITRGLQLSVILISICLSISKSRQITHTPGEVHTHFVVEQFCSLTVKNIVRY